jgi:DHA3 family tetracycline resistance protein-like MFS transporter
MKKLTPVTIYLATALITGFSDRLVFTTSAIYRVESVGLNPLQLVLVGTTLEVTAFLFEIPTGVVADTYSRRLSVIIGMFLVGIGFVVEGVAPLFPLVLLSQVIWGLGWTFISGARSAWITDEIGVESTAPVFLRSQRTYLIGSLLALPVSILVANQSLAYPFLFGGLARVLLAAALILWMPETGFKRTPKEERQGWADTVSTAREGFSHMRSSSVLRSYLLIGLLVGLYSEGWDRLRDFHLLENFTFPDLFGFSLGSVEWFAILNGVVLGLGVLANGVAERRFVGADSRGLTSTLQGLYALMVISIVIFALTGNFLVAVLALMLFATFRSVTYPLTNAWLNRYIPSQVRATVLSMTSQLDALGQAAGGPIVGLLGNLFSVRTAILSAAGILSPTVLLYGRAKKLANGEAKEQEKDI